MVNDVYRWKRTQCVKDFDESFVLNDIVRDENNNRREGLPIREVVDCKQRQRVNVESHQYDEPNESADLDADTGPIARIVSFTTKTKSMVCLTSRCSSSLVLPMYIIVNGDKRVDV